MKFLYVYYYPFPVISSIGDANLVKQGLYSTSEICESLFRKLPAPMNKMFCHLHFTCTELSSLAFNHLHFYKVKFHLSKKAAIAIYFLTLA